MNLARLFQKGKERLAIDRRKLSKGFGSYAIPSHHFERVAKKEKEVKNRLRPSQIRGRIAS
jgi:hypothetical protein